MPTPPLDSASLTYWNRLESRPFSRMVPATFAAPVYDPLWFLTRQWQMGALKAQDGGMPAFAEVKVNTGPFARFSTGGSSPTALSEGAPIESQAFGEPTHADFSLQVELGQNFERLLSMTLNPTDTAAVMDAFRTAHPLSAPQAHEFDPLDFETSQFVLVCGRTAWNAFAAYEFGVQILAGQTPAIPGASLGVAIETAIRNTLSALANWAHVTIGPIGDGDPIAWQHRRLEYDLQAEAIAPDVDTWKFNVVPSPNGKVDWASFDFASTEPVELTSSLGARDTKTQTIIPTNVQFRGMVSNRFWAFESAKVNFADVTVDSRDLLKMLFVDFMMIHGTNWYTFPLSQKLGTVASIEHLVVHDVFGKATRIRRPEIIDQPASPAERWSVFSIARANGGAPVPALVLPPTTDVPVERAAIVEEVMFTRDEMANMAWAVERVTSGPIGQRRQGAERHAVAGAPFDVSTGPTGSGIDLRYLIETVPPVHWIPLVPVQVSSDPNKPVVLLEKGAVLRPKPSSPAETMPVPSFGKILAPDNVGPGESEQFYQIHEEEIPRSGSRVRRAYMRTRWFGGETVVWLARQRLTGIGESSSGLQFDRARQNT
jgi:hypothetical protein